MTTADPSFSDEILQTISGTTTAWLPLTTPWVSIAACSSQLYGEFGVGPVIAFDPYYGSVIASNQIPCLPPEATVWYNQPADGKTLYLLGPTFVCPAAYYPAQTLAVNSGTQEILCCPTSYTLGPILTHNPRTDFPAECYSTCTSGEAITYMTQSSLGGSWFPFTRGIQSDPFTVYGIYVNGFNVVATTTSSSSSSSSTTPSVPASTTPSISSPTSSTSGTSAPSMSTSSGLSTGAAAGIGVGVAAGILLVVFLAFFLYLRRKKSKSQQTPYPATQSYRSESTYNNDPSMRQEMDSRNKGPNYYGGPTHELPSHNSQSTYELH